MEKAIVNRNLYTNESKYGGIFGLESLLLKACCNPNLTPGCILHASYILQWSTICQVTSQMYKTKKHIKITLKIQK